MSEFDARESESSPMTKEELENSSDKQTIDKQQKEVYGTCAKANIIIGTIAIN